MQGSVQGKTFGRSSPEVNRLAKANKSTEVVIGSCCKLSGQIVRMHSSFMNSPSILSINIIDSRRWGAGGVAQDQSLSICK